MDVRSAAELVWLAVRDHQNPRSWVCGVGWHQRPI